ncbi:hypothetical protein Tco_1520456, partial [Tanacetum coccineum]
HDSLRAVWVFDVPIATPRVSFAASLMILARVFHIESASLEDMTSACVVTPSATLDLKASVASPVSWKEHTSLRKTLQSLHALRSPRRTNK